MSNASDLASFLHGHFATAAQVAAIFGYSKATAHRRIKAVKKEYVLQTCRVREGSTGPESTAYAIVGVKADAYKR